MAQNTSELSENETRRNAGTPHLQATGTSLSETRGIVVTVPVESIRWRVMSDVSRSLRNPEKSAVSRKLRMKKVLSCDLPEDAIAAMMDAYPKAGTKKKACVEFINELRLAFPSLDKRDFEKNWQNLKNDAVFESATFEYLEILVPNIFKNKYNRSLYEDIEFGLFLLGSSPSFDILNDIRISGMSGMTELFARRHTLIIREQTRLQDIDLSISRLEIRLENEKKSSSENNPDISKIESLLEWKKSERTKVAEAFERKVSSFEQLCEIVNKIAAMQSISALDKDRALSLIRMIAAQIATVGEELEQSEYDPFARNKLRFIEGKLLWNYSHLEFFDGKTPAEIMRKADRICESIQRWFELQKKTDFWWKPERLEMATLVTKGNIAFVRLTALQKIKEFGKLRPEEVAQEKKYLDDLFSLYAKMSWSDAEFESVEAVALDFISRGDHDEFMIETMHHLLLFSDLPVETLCKVATKLIGDNQYNNAFHEEFKIKLFSVILEKFRNVERSERTVKVAHWIREYAKKNEKISGLVMSFSQIYISLAIFLSSLPDRESKKSAVECYLRASRVTDETWKLKFHKHEAAFLEGIGWKAELEHLEELLSVTKISNIQSELLELTTRTVKGKEKQGANAKACEIIEEFFFGICTAEIRTCDCGNTEFWCEKTECSSPSAISAILRGNDHVQIPLWLWYFLVLQFPANLKTLFENILEQRKDIIVAAISNILSIVTQDREKSEANLYLSEARAEAERRRLTDELTGLPNKQAYKDDLPLYSEMADVASILVKIENLREVGQLYWMRTGEKFVKGIVDGPINHFFTSNPDHWKAYSMSEDEILIIGDYHASPGGMPFVEIIPHLRELFSSFAFYPEASRNRTEEKDGLCLRAIVSMGCSDQISTDIYEKLTIALRDTVDWPGIVFYEENRHSEEIILANIRGGSLISEALKENRVVPHYQAIVNNRTGKVVKYECLARIVEHDGKIIPPSSFVEHAKRAGTIPLITRMIFSKACRDLRGTNTHFSFNISWQDLADPELIPELLGEMEKNGIDPSRVTCEILEEALLVNRGEYVEKIATLKKAGCKIALDDFGSEWSNFSRFEKDWWPDVIKIDGPSFIKNLDQSPEKQRIVRAIVKAWQELGCEIVAERVDSEAIWDIVTEMDIQCSQGYLFHEPQWLVSGESLPDTIDVEAIRLKTRSAVSLVDPEFTKA